MGQYKKEKARQSRDKSTTGTSGPSVSNVTQVKGVNFYRDHKAVARLNMLKGGKPTRNAAGTIIKAAAFQTRLGSGAVARVAPNRRWFENTRVIGQRELTQFREAMADVQSDPYSVLLQQNKLPMSLLKDSVKVGILAFFWWGF